MSSPQRTKACKCVDCKCDPCECGDKKGAAAAASCCGSKAKTAACACGPDCKCDPCTCGEKKGAAAAAGSSCCGTKGKTASCACTDCKCDPCKCGEKGGASCCGSKGRTAACACGPDCKCDPCTCGEKGGASCCGPKKRTAACACGPDCKCDPCTCGTGDKGCCGSKQERSPGLPTSVTTTITEAESSFQTITTTTVVASYARARSIRPRVTTQSFTEVPTEDDSATCGDGGCCNTGACDPAAIALEFYNVLESGVGAEGVAKYLAPGAEFECMVLPQRTLADYADFLKTLKSAVPDCESPAVSVTSDGLTITIVGVFEGTHLNEVVGVFPAPLSPPRRTKCHFTYTIYLDDECHVTRMLKVFDIFSFYRGFGWTLPSA